MTINATIIDEAVADLAKYFGEILVSKRSDKDIAAADLFEEFSEYLKANDDGRTPQSLSSKLNEMSSASGVPLEVLLHTARGARLVERLNNLTKKEEPMSRSEEMQAMRQFIQSTPGGFTSIAKRVIAEGGTSLSENEYTALWETEAGGTSEFVKQFTGPRDARHEAYDVVRDATQVQAYLKAFPNRMSVAPVVVGGEDATAVNDPVKAAADLQALVEAQRKLAPTLTTSALYDRVLKDPANKATVDRAFRRPDSSSPSYDALQR
jgi:hypothetical protein